VQAEPAQHAQRAQLLQPVSIATEQLGHPSRAPEGRKPGPLLKIGLIAAVVLLLISGTVAWFQFFPGGRILLAGLETTSTPRSTSTPAITPTNTAAPLPSASINEAGTLLYGTSQPGFQCDPLATWTRSDNAALTCANGLTLAHTNGDKLASTTLDQLPQNQLPANYVLQAQVDLNATNGTFGLIFRHQNSGSIVYLIDPATSTFRAIVTNDSTGSTINLYNGSINLGRLSGTITVDIIVQANNYNLYINGKFQGLAGSSYYPQGGIGLAASKGTTVQFKNIAVYALR
jgi:hypothetical protein